MTIQTCIEKIQNMDFPQDLERGYGGQCPCFSVTKTIVGKKLHIWGRCWRVSEHGQDLYVWGDFPLKDVQAVGMALKRKLDAQQWYGKYTLILTQP